MKLRRGRVLDSAASCEEVVRSARGGWAAGTTVTATHLAPDPIQLHIIAQPAAAGQDLTCGSIKLPVKTSTATHHFSVLRRAGVLHQYYTRKSRMNVLRRADMEAAFPGFLTSVIAATAGILAHWFSSSSAGIGPLLGSCTSGWFRYGPGSGEGRSVRPSHRDPKSPLSMPPMAFRKGRVGASSAAQRVAT
ncbi:hypothetical protein ACFQ46_23410 [Kineococcus sp. GCM10028916]|uniref:hypothetical protein n=1 Tax=Kineococcus sp. GCM10028916 TaxID=3273394 RepID=UPI003630920F